MTRCEDWGLWRSIWKGTAKLWLKAPSVNVLVTVGLGIWLPTSPRLKIVPSCPDSVLEKGLPQDLSTGESQGPLRYDFIICYSFGGTWAPLSENALKVWWLVLFCFALFILTYHFSGLFVPQLWSFLKRLHWSSLSLFQHNMSTSILSLVM